MLTRLLGNDGEINNYGLILFHDFVLHSSDDTTTYT